MIGDDDLDKVIVEAVEALGADEVLEILQDYERLKSGKITPEEYVLGDLMQYVALTINEAQEVGNELLTATVDGHRIILSTSHSGNYKLFLTGSIEEIGE